MLCRFMIRRIVETSTRLPSMSSSPWIRVYPRVGSPAPFAPPGRPGCRRSMAGRSGSG